MSKRYIRHAAELVTCKGRTAKRGKEMSDIGLIHDGAVIIEDDKITAVGTTEELDRIVKDSPEYEVIDATGKAVMPGFVDSHTHFLFGGYRADEFGWRLKGDSYMSIMERGGGINATVVPTRNASVDDFVALGLERMNRMLEFGVTTVEGKSGYGMDHDTEIRMLEAYKKLNESHPVDVVSTFLGPHSVLPEWKGKEREFLDYMLTEVMPEVKEKGLAEFADIFTEKGVFDVPDSEYYLTKAAEMGFKLKVHADEITPGFGASEMAARVGAFSADHLLKASDEGIRMMAEGRTISTVLPLTAFCLREPYAPARKMIDSGCAVAMASDLNPGSCFSNSIPLMIATGCIYMNMSIEEVITAMTINGAAAVDRADQIGSIEEGKQADIIFLKFPSIQYLPYHTGVNLVETVIKSGKTVYHKEW
ncbi:MAG: imidazolonepropionase [[Clostridium] aminophilum]|uniref:imidazolonepropionase n=1 Tax=[Clostridium] aminophilum TaxID=1526 RepID=UPI0026F0F233|nr:imidazolonepropionase [[Clostridium] aminophilum]MDD6197067.1 imidazolonepropionase [[Clostridium] aminophilum]